MGLIRACGGGGMASDYREPEPSFGDRIAPFLLALLGIGLVITIGWLIVSPRSHYQSDPFYQRNR